PMSERTVGFIGLGRMGGHMALRLLDAGHDLVVFDTADAAMDPLVQKGAVSARSPEAVGAATDVVFVSLPTPEIVHDVVHGAQGVVRGGRARIIVDLSTTGPTMATRVASDLEPFGI